MKSASQHLALRGRLGDSATAALDEWGEERGREWRDDVVAMVEAKFERRLAQELACLRVEFATSLGLLRKDLQHEIAASRVELIKWSFVFWVGQVLALGSLMALMLRFMAR